MTAHRVLIVDDEPHARRRLRTLLEAEDDFEVAAECGDGDQAVAALSSQAFDLVLLDVAMPGRSGLDVVRAVGPEHMPVVVFCTAFDQHAVAAFELHALDYLLKPFDRERFARMLARARRELAERRGGALAERLERLLADLARTRDATEPLVLRTGRRTWIVKPDEIHWIEAAGNYARLHCGPTERLVRETLASLEQRLAPHGFLRIHRSRLVNPGLVREVQSQRGGEVRLRLADGTTLLSGRQFRRVVLERWPGSRGPT